MKPGPPKTFEALVAVLVPPACREEVLGDLHERYGSPRQYGLDAASTVPLRSFAANWGLCGSPLLPPRRCLV